MQCITECLPGTQTVIARVLLSYPALGCLFQVITWYRNRTTLTFISFVPEKQHMGAELMAVVILGNLTRGPTGFRPWGLLSLPKATQGLYCQSFEINPCCLHVCISEVFQ